MSLLRPLPFFCLCLLGLMSSCGEKAARPSPPPAVPLPTPEPEALKAAQQAAQQAQTEGRRVSAEMEAQRLKAGALPGLVPAAPPVLAVPQPPAVDAGTLAPLPAGPAAVGR